MNEFGEYLKELRGNRSFREMERITGLSHTYLSTLEKGVDPRSGKERKPTPETLMQLSKTLKVSYSELMVKAGYKDTDNSLEKAFQDFVFVMEKIELNKEMKLRNEYMKDHHQKIKPAIEEHIKKTNDEIAKVKDQIENASNSANQIELLQKQIELVKSVDASLEELSILEKRIEHFESKNTNELKANEQLIKILSAAKDNLIKQIENSVDNTIKKLEAN